MDKYEKIKQLYIKSDKTDDEIQKDIKQKEADIRRKQPKFNDEQVMRHLYKTIFTERKRALTDIGGTEVSMLIFIAGKPFDWTKTKHKEIEKYIKTNGIKKAIADGYCEVPEWTPDGKPKKIVHLYYWEKNQAGKDNQMYGDPLPDSSWLRTIGGIASRDGKLFKKFTMSISNEFADPKSPDFKKVVVGKMLKANVSISNETDASFELNSRSSSIFTEINDSASYHLTEQEIKELYKDDWVNLATIENDFEHMNNIWTGDHSRGTHKTCVTKATVVSIEPPTKKASARVYVDDIDTRGLFDKDGNELNPFMCWWNDNLPFNFGVDTEMIIWFDIGQSETKEDDEFTGKWGPLTFNVNGCYITDLVEKETKEIKKDEVASGQDYIPNVDELDLSTDELDLDSLELPNADAKIQPETTETETDSNDNKNETPQIETKPEVKQEVKPEASKPQETQKKKDKPKKKGKGDIEL